MSKQSTQFIIQPDFAIIRPVGSYRVNANVILIRSDPPILFEAGIHPRFAFPRLKSLFTHLNLKFSDVEYLIVSHNHQDHFAYIDNYRQFFQSAQTICHQKDLDFIHHPFLMSEAWKMALQNVGMSKIKTQIYAGYYTLLSPIYFRAIQKPQLIHKIVVHPQRLPKIKGIQILETPGHTQGHISLLDNHRNLYLADFVPFTPWIDPTSEGLKTMLRSIEKILQYNTTQVKYSVRSHGDTRRKRQTEWEIAPWVEEHARFQLFYENIHETLDLIPHKLRHRELDIYQITSLFKPGFEKYSNVMRRLFIPPQVSWGIAYAKALEEQGIVTCKRKGSQLLWTA